MHARSSIFPLLVGLVLAAAPGCGAEVEGSGALSSAATDELPPTPRRLSEDELARAWPTSDPTPHAIPGERLAFEPGPARADQPACSDGRDGPQGDILLTVMSKGLPRTALVHVPADYHATRGSMVVLNFHGFTSDALQEVLLSRMRSASDCHGFIAVHPQGIARSWNAGACCGQAWVDAVDDVQFVRDLLDTLERRWCVDTKRVFATGMSNGGFLSHHLGCELSDRIAAIAPVAGVHGYATSSCRPRRPVPVLQFHGTWDPLVPYHGGIPVFGLDIPLPFSFPSVARTMDDWRARNACTSGPRRVFSRGDTSCVAWSGCRDNADVVLCTTERGGHTWPGGMPVPLLGKTTNAINATETMISFFEAHPMP